MGDGPAHRVERRDRIGFGGGERQLPLGLGEPGAGIHAHPSARDEFASHIELAARREKGSRVRRARVRETLRLVAGAGESKIQVGDGILEAVEIGDRMLVAGGLERLEPAECLEDRLRGVRIRRTIDFGSCFGEVGPQCVAPGGERGGGVFEVCRRRLDRVEQSVRFVQLRRRRGEAFGDGVDARRGDRAFHLVGRRAGLSDEPLGVLRMIPHRSEGRPGEP